MIEIIVNNDRTFHLPKEVFLNITSFLAPKNIVRFLTVNSAWYQLLSNNDLWKELCQKISVENANDCSYLKFYPQLMGINFARNARLGNLQIVKSLCSHLSAINCMRVTQKHIIVGAYYMSKIQIWNRFTCLQANSVNLNLHDVDTKVLECHPNGVQCLNSIGEHLVVVGFLDNTILIKESSTGTTIATLIGHEDQVLSLDVNDTTIASGSNDTTICIWDQQGILKNILRGHQRRVTCLQITDKMIISGSADKTICIWDQTINSPLHTLIGHTKSVTCLKGIETIIISGSKDKTIRIWECSTYQLMHVLIGHTESITCLEIIDNILVSGSDDNTLRIWDFSTGAHIKTISLETLQQLAPPICMQFSNDMLFIGSEDGEIRLLSYS